jgi:amidohydrolase
MPVDYKKFISATIDQQTETLWGISTELFNNPELAFREFHACTLLTEFLRKSGFSLESGIGGLNTAFRATLANDSHPAIAILAEYDALTGLGHACGHNLIAAAAVGAGMALAAFNPKLPGSIQVIGTPAEEGGGGKILLANAGVFRDVDAAMMFHPASKNMVLRTSLASSKMKIEFYGEPSHAAAAPEEGINALDALILTFNNIHALRPTFKPKDVVAGIIKNGGEAANIIPAYTSADFSIRSLTTMRRDDLIDKVKACAQAGAQAVGCQVTCTVTPGYREMIPNHVLAGSFKANLETLGFIVENPDPLERMGSTDMGDVSHLIPAIHPYLAIAPENIAGHTLEFKEYVVSDAGKRAMLVAAKALAMTAVDLLMNPNLLVEAREELDSTLK